MDAEKEEEGAKDREEGQSRNLCRAANIDSLEVVGGFSELPRPFSNLQKPSKGLSTGKVVCKP